LTVDTDNPAPAVVNQSGYALHRGISRQAVSKMVREGRLSGPAISSDGLSINVAEADRQLGPLTRPSPLPAALAPADDDAGDDETFAGYRSRREAANARLAEAAAGEKEGRLIDRVAAERTFEHLTRVLRDRILQVPSEVAADCEALPDEASIEARIRMALEDALKDTIVVAYQLDPDGQDEQAEDE
jgi:hypothetical protein